MGHWPNGWTAILTNPWGGGPAGGSWTGRPSFWSRYDLGWDPAHVQALPNRELARIRSLTLPQVLGKGRVVAGSGGYVYRQFGNGYVQVVDGPALKGQLLMPRGNAKAWQAITREIGAVPGRSGLLA